MEILASVYISHSDADKFKFGKIYKLINKESAVLVAVLSNNLIDDISCKSIIGCEIVNGDNPKFISWKFAEVDDEVNYNGTHYNILEILSFAEKLFQKAFAFVMQNGTVAEIRGNSPEEAIKEIGNWLEGRKNNQQRVFEIFNDSRGVFPVTLLSRQLGSDYYSIWGHIICENKLKLNNYSKGTGTCYVLSNDAICTLGILEATKDIETSAFIFAKQTKANIVSMLSLLINDLQNGAVGSLQIDNGKVYKTVYDKNYKKGASSFFGELLEFVNGVTEVEANPYISKQQEITSLFIKENLSSERYLLGLAKSDKKYVIVTDEPFVCIMCELENIPHISTVDLLLSQNMNHNIMLQYLKRLDSLNFLNYFSPNTYKKIADSVMKIDIEKRKEFLDEFQKWLVPEQRSKEHSYRIFNTYRELLAEDRNSFYAYTLSNIGHLYFSELYPEQYKEIVDQFDSIRIQIAVPDNSADEQ